MHAAVIGYGSIGRRHVENLRELGVDEITVVRRKDANKAFSTPSDVAVVNSVEDALSTEPALAIVATPTALHLDASILCIDSGVPVLLEKPASDGYEQAKRFLKRVEQAEAFVAMAYCMRFHRAYCFAHDFLKSGGIGRVLYAKAWFESYLPDWHPWEDYRQSYAARRELGGGALRTLDHEIDFFIWCLGEPVSVSGTALASDGLETSAEDYAVILAEHPGQVRSTISLSLCRRDRSRGFEFIGETGTLSWDLDSGELSLCRGSATSPEILVTTSGDEIDKMYLRLLQSVINGVQGEPVDRTPPSLEAGVATLRVVDQVEKARLFQDKTNEG